MMVNKEEIMKITSQTAQTVKEILLLEIGAISQEQLDKMTATEFQLKLYKSVIETGKELVARTMEMNEDVELE